VIEKLFERNSLIRPHQSTLFLGAHQQRRAQQQKEKKKSKCYRILSHQTLLSRRKKVNDFTGNLCSRKSLTRGLIEFEISFLNRCQLKLCESLLIRVIYSISFTSADENNAKDFNFWLFSLFVSVRM
jgi:hypothetical protein